MNPPREPSSRWNFVVLGVAIACGCLSVVASDREFLAVREWMAKQSSWQPSRSTLRIEPIVSRSIQDLEAFLCPIHLGLALVAFRPRRRAHHQRLGPGLIAIAIVGALILHNALAIVAFEYGPEIWAGFRASSALGPPKGFWSLLPIGTGHAIPLAVGSAWIYLAVTGGWRRAGQSLEKLGRWLVVFWVVAAVVTWVLE